MASETDPSGIDPLIWGEQHSQIFGSALAWQRGSDTAVTCEIGTPGFDEALGQVMPALGKALGERTSGFLNLLYARANTLIEARSPQAGERRWEFVFVPFLANDGDLEPVTGELEKTLGFTEALQIAGYASPEDFLLFFPRPIRADWLVSRRPGEVLAAFSHLVASLKGRSSSDETREAEFRLAFEASIDPDGTEVEPGTPCVRALLGLRVLDHTGPVPAGDPHVVIDVLADRYPDLACGPPGSLVETLGQMAVMEMGQQWLLSALEAGFRLDLGHDPEPWAVKLGRVHLYTTDTAVHIVPETARGVLDPLTLPMALWHFVAPEILAAISLYGGRLMRHEGPFAMPRWHMN